MPPKFLNELRESVDIPLTFTNRLLQQFGFAGIDPYTLGYSRITCSNYTASTSGERQFNHSLTNIPVYVATDDRLQFGWDESAIWRNTDLHIYEYEHLLLIVALGECFPESYVALVLSALGVHYEDEARINPSVASWKRLTHSLNGLLADTDFPLIVDDRQQLDPHRIVSGHTTSDTSSLPKPGDFAKALKALFEICKSGRLTLVGGDSLGWFAAFTEIFLDINVEIYSGDGSLLHKKSTTCDAVLRLVFAHQTSDSLPPIMAQEGGGAVVTLSSGAEENRQSVPKLPFTGRVAGTAVLSRTFGSCFHKIAHEESKILVQAMGGACRMFQMLAELDDSSKISILPENRENKASLGIGLIQTLITWFPELRHLQGRLERLQTMSFDEVSSKCETGATGLIRLCGCTVCAAPYYTNIDPGTLPQSFCLLAVMETILNLGLAMSRITVVPKLFPSRAGILCIYERQVAKLLKAKEETGREGERIKILFIDDWNANYARRLQNAAAMFSGSWPRGDLPEGLVALSHEGICVYVTSIQKKSSRKEDAGLIRVQAGNLVWNRKVYSRACQGRPEDLASEDSEWDIASCRHLPPALYIK